LLAQLLLKPLSTLIHSLAIASVWAICSISVRSRSFHCLSSRPVTSKPIKTPHASAANDLRARQQGSGLPRLILIRPRIHHQVALMEGETPQMSFLAMSLIEPGNSVAFSGSNLKAFDPPTPQLSLDKPLSESAWLGLLYQFFCTHTKAAPSPC